MKRIGVLHNTIREYSWGSHTTIAALLGKPLPTKAPQAELWMGAHPQAPSLVELDGRMTRLTDAIFESPEDILGSAVAARFGRRLPFLFKVLAAAKPLSIQVHPSKSLARRGFAREEQSGIPLDSPRRSYRDANHKPECLCALTPFWMLNGFRKGREIAARLQAFCPETLSGETMALRDAAGFQGLERFFEALLALSPNRRGDVLREALDAARKGRADDNSCLWIRRLYRDYPEDIGVLAPVYLNLVRLDPGQAIYLPAGRLHSYLEGAGIELMANSDNVLRGGLTSKHVDTAEFLKGLDYGMRTSSLIVPVKRNDNELVYETSAEEFILSVIGVSRGGIYRSRKDRSVEILLCTEGEGALTNVASGETLTVSKGMSLLIPAAVTQYSIQGQVEIYKAGVPNLGQQEHSP